MLDVVVPAGDVDPPWDAHPVRIIPAAAKAAVAFTAVLTLLIGIPVSFMFPKAINDLG